MPEEFDLSSHGITVKNIVRNASPSRLYELALRDDSVAVMSKVPE